MKTPLASTIAIIILTTLLISACANSATPPTTAEVTQPTTAGPAAPQADTPQVQEPTQAAPTAGEAPAATQSAPVVEHKDIPGNPRYAYNVPDECNTGFNFKPGFTLRTACDRWATNVLERPVSSDMNLYFHYIDILGSSLGSDNMWIYARLELFGAGMPEDGSPFAYYVELHTDQDVRGETLVLADNLDLFANEWTTTGVKVYVDRDGDVGALTAVRPDYDSGNGYETLVFDQGQGEDPDLAWVRHNPDLVHVIEFAFKADAVDRATSLMWWGGAMRGALDPQRFDLVDSYGETALFEVDSTCGWVMGSQKGYNFKLRYIAPNPTATERPDKAQPAPKVCVQPPHPNPQNNCWVWEPDKCAWVCYN